MLQYVQIGRKDFADKKKNGVNRLGLRARKEMRRRMWRRIPQHEGQENDGNEDDAVTER